MQEQDRVLLLAMLWIVYTIVLLLIVWTAVAGGGALRRALYTTPLPGPARSSVSLDFAKAAATYGSVFRASTGRVSGEIILCDPTAIAHFYANAPAIYRSTDSARSFIKNVVGRGLTWAEDAYHPMHRQALAPMFSNSAVEGFCGTFFDVITKVQDVWSNALASRPRGMVVDIQHWMNSVVLDSLGLVGFAHDFESLKGDYCIVTAAFYALRAPRTNSPSDLIFRLASSTMPVLGNIPTAKNRIIQDFRAYMGGIAGDILERNYAQETKAQGSEGTEDKSILGLLIKSLAENPAGEFRLSHAEVVAQMVRFDTTAGKLSNNVTGGYLRNELALRPNFASVTLSWVLVELAKNPVIQDKLRNELRQVSGTFEYSKIVKLPYLHAVVDETLRLHPPVGSTTRVAVEDDIIPLSSPILTRSGETVASIHVAKGTVVTAPIHYINTSETLWGAGAMKFDPGRWWQDKSNDDFPGNRHLAFGDGPRACIGADFSLALIKVVLHVVVTNFTFSFPDGPETIIESTGGRAPQPRMTGGGTELPMVVQSI